jgi:hypothetical protein
LVTIRILIYLFAFFFFVQSFYYVFKKKISFVFLIFSIVGIAALAVSRFYLQYHYKTTSDVVSVVGFILLVVGMIPVAKLSVAYFIKGIRGK